MSKVWTLFNSNVPIYWLINYNKVTVLSKMLTKKVVGEGGHMETALPLLLFCRRKTDLKLKVYLLKHKKHFFTYEI